MKQFDSAEASLSSPTKLDFKIMKETADDVSTENQRLSEAQTLEVQNGSKKLLESLDLNTSSVAASENGVKKDTARTSGSDSEKENVVTANGFPEEAETECLLAKSKSSDQAGHASPKIGAEGTNDCSLEESTGIRTTQELSGTSLVSDCEEDKINSIMPDNLPNGDLEDTIEKEAILLSNGDLKLESEQGVEAVCLDEPMDTADLDESEKAFDSLDEVLGTGEPDCLEGPRADDLGLLEDESNSFDGVNVEGSKSPEDETMDIEVEETELMASPEGLSTLEQTCDEGMELSVLDAPELPLSDKISSDIMKSPEALMTPEQTCDEEMETGLLEAPELSLSDKISSDVISEADHLKPSDELRKTEDPVYSGVEDEKQSSSDPLKTIEHTSEQSSESDTIHSLSEQLEFVSRDDAVEDNELQSSSKSSKYIDKTCHESLIESGDDKTCFKDVIESGEDKTYSEGVIEPEEDKTYSEGLVEFEDNTTCSEDFVECGDDKTCSGSVIESEEVKTDSEGLVKSEDLIKSEDNKTCSEGLIEPADSKTCSEDLIEGADSKTCSEDLIEGADSKTCSEDLIEPADSKTCSEDLIEPADSKTCSEDLIEAADSKTCSEDLIEAANSKTCSEDLIEPGDSKTCSEDLIEPGDSKTCSEDLIKTCSEDLIEPEVDKSFESLDEPEGLSDIVNEASKPVSSDNSVDTTAVQSSDKEGEISESESVKEQSTGRPCVTGEVSSTDELMEDTELHSLERETTEANIVSEPLVDSCDKLMKSIDNAIGVDVADTQLSEKIHGAKGKDLSNAEKTIVPSSDKLSDVKDVTSSEKMKVSVEVDGEELSSSEKNCKVASPLVKCNELYRNSAGDLDGCEEKKNSEKGQELKVSYSQINTNSLSTAARNILGDIDISDFDSGTVTSLHTTSLRDDIEDDLRAMEHSMWSDDVSKAKDKLVTKISSEAKTIPVGPHDNVPEEERLNRKRTSEGVAGEVAKRTKVLTESEVDSDVGNDTSKRRPDNDGVDREAKKVRTMEEEGKQTPVYRSNLDKIIDQVASGVLNGESEEIADGSVIEDDSQDVTGVESDKESTDTLRNSKPMPFVRKLHAEELKNLTRNDLEELVVQKICEVLTERSNVGELRQRTTCLEQLVENWRKKAHSLGKQVRDMEMVVKRFINDQKNKKDRIVLPVKITRSVGLQVHLGQTNQMGFNKSRAVPEVTRPPIRRRSERPAPPQAPSPAPSTPKPPTSTAASNTPQKIAPTPTKSTVSTPNSPAVPSAAVVRTVAVTATTKTVSTPVKTNVSRSVSTNSSSLTNVAARLASATVTPRVSKPVYSTASATPIAPKPNQDLIDLTDEEDRSKSNTLRNALTVTSTDALIPTSVTSVLPSTAISTTGAGRGIRVVQQHQLTASNTTTAAILTPTGTEGGQRLAYLVPTSTMSNQQRQLVLAPQQVRAGSVMSVPGRPTILFKSGPVVSMPQGTLTPGTMIQTGVASSSSPLLRPNSTLTTLAPQQRPTPIRMPVTMATSVGRMTTTVNTLVTTQPTMASHPAPLPSLPPYAPTSLNLKLAPPKPELKISKVSTKNTQGIVLSWNMTLSSEHEEVASYQLYAYQEGAASPSTSLWKKVGDVKALPLPMACTLTQFQEGHKYHFAVRAVDVHMRCGQFSAPGNIMLTRK